MADQNTFTLAEALAAQQALRDAAGVQEEHLDLAELIGMVSEEIDLLQEQGKSWDDIAAMLKTATGKPITGADVKKYYVSPEERDRWEDEDEYEDD
jgi:hypothetical protein